MEQSLGDLYPIETSCSNYRGDGYLLLWLKLWILTENTLPVRVPVRGYSFALRTNEPVLLIIIGMIK